MALSLETILTSILGGAFVGTGYYLYKNNYLSDLLGDIGIGDGNGNGTTTEEPPVDDGNGDGDITEPYPVPGTGLTYYIKRKAQCRDNHLLPLYIQRQGVRILNYRLYNDGSVRPQVCATPSSLLILITIDSQDLSSAGILTSMGFTEYYAPLGPDTYLTTTTSSLALVQTGAAPNHRAYRVYRNTNTNG